jgi:hypothetical protein
MDGRRIELSYVVSHCELVSTDHKLQAASGGPRRDEHMAKAQAAEEIASHFRDADEAGLPLHEIETAARERDPSTYAAYDALLLRLASEGADEGYALRVAEATYGLELSEARSSAAEALSAPLMGDSEDAGYDKGLADAIAWHETQALTADHMESSERIDVRKTKYRQRADRHRLYARKMKAELEGARIDAIAKRRTEREAVEPTLPFGRGMSTGQAEKESEGIPLAVQMRFLKKGEVFDDEGFD